MTDPREVAMDAARELQGFARSQAALALLNLLDAMDAVYHDELRIVLPEKLARTQGAAAQLRALRRVLTDQEEAPFPKV
ncbi:hypothetical protein [Cupriavidus sp. UYPR2.512]|uniref:hypothetical protein n=1 Tax=Cupriavidus sp. UYPR2.512 TaxID=1080187 RepID=UPI00035CB41C|nr:hypothetical protein [Cupriavidus sp. UYPR2.512]UIF90865.1 hypothetical protein KAF44_32265 [Cupriavidus necator]